MPFVTDKFKSKNGASVSEEFSGIYLTYHLFKIRIIKLSKSSKYLEVELKASIILV